MKYDANVLPAYHLITRSRSVYAYSCSAEQADAHFRILASRGVTATFDDGHISHHQYALPLAEKHRTKCIFFAIAGWANKRVDALSWSQLRDLVAAGHEVQSHGFSHCFLTQCTDSELKRELDGSKRELEQRLGIPVDAISIPHGRWDARVMQACAEHGYRRVYTSDFAPPAQIEGVHVIGRFMVIRSTTERDLERKLCLDSRAWRRMQAQQRAKRILRGVIGEAAYHAVWGVLRRRPALQDPGKR